MTPAETLRAAAARVREVAQTASHLSTVPWRVDDADGSYVAAHIALWHPGVALAVADWLDDAAGSLEANDNARALGYVPKGYVAALAVARVLLPVEASGEGLSV